MRARRQGLHELTQSLGGGRPDRAVSGPGLAGGGAVTRAGERQRAACSRQTAGLDAGHRAACPVVTSVGGQTAQSRPTVVPRFSHTHRAKTISDRSSMRHWYPAGVTLSSPLPWPMTWATGLAAPRRGSPRGPARSPDRNNPRWSRQSVGSSPSRWRGTDPTR